jgi:hypothetical protein
MKSLQGQDFNQEELQIKLQSSEKNVKVGVATPGGHGSSKGKSSGGGGIPPRYLNPQ